MLAFNRLETVESGAFCGLGALKELSFVYNELEELDRDALEGLDALQRLELAHNRLKVLRAEAFHLNARLTANTRAAQQLRGDDGGARVSQLGCSTPARLAQESPQVIAGDAGGARECHEHEHHYHDGLYASGLA